MQDLISVIVPVYNIMDCLPKCVQSICDQTYSNLEILLVDDGSNDGTEKLVDELAKKDERIRVFHKPNGGSSSARNLGIRQAKGKYLGFVDSDDYIDSHMYEKLMECIKEKGVRIAQTSRDEIDEQEIVCRMSVSHRRSFLYVTQRALCVSFYCIAEIVRIVQNWWTGLFLKSTGSRKVY